MNKAQEEITVEFRVPLSLTSKVIFHKGEVRETKTGDGSRILCEITAINKVFIIGSYFAAEASAIPIHKIE